MPVAVGILMYHAVIDSPLAVEDWCFLDEGAFRNQMRYVRDHFEVIPLSAVTSRLNARDFRRPPVVVTFDDGFQNNYDVAFPILHEEGVLATLFLATSFVDSDDTIWFCRLHQAISMTGLHAVEWNGEQFDLSHPAAQAAAAQRLQASLKRLSQPRLVDELRRICVALGQDPDEPVAAVSPFRILDRASIDEMNASGLIEFGGHTHSHAILSLLEPEDSDRETQQSLDIVTRLTGRPCRLFAYPNGRREDYSDRVVDTLRRLGVQTCVTAIEGLNDTETGALELRRYGIGGPSSAEDFARFVSAMQAGNA